MYSENQQYSADCMEELIQVIDDIRNGCPRAAAHTHKTLAEFAVFEAAEFFETVQDDDTQAMIDELGDLLLQVVFQARVSQDNENIEKRFTVDDVAKAITSKMYRRHPHVFSNEVANTVDEVNIIWQREKEAEKQAKKNAL